MTKIRLPGGNFIFKLPIQWIKITPPGFEHASFVSLTVYFKNFRDKRNWKNLQFVRSGNLCGFKRSGDICYVVKIIISKQTVHMSQYMKSNQPFRKTCWTFFFFFTLSKWHLPPVWQLICSHPLYHLLPTWSPQATHLQSTSRVTLTDCFLFKRAWNNIEGQIVTVIIDYHLALIVVLLY